MTKKQWFDLMLLQVMAALAVFLTGVYLGIDAAKFVQQAPLTMPANCHNTSLLSGKPYALVNDDGTVMKYFTYDCFLL